MSLREERSTSCLFGLVCLCQGGPWSQPHLAYPRTHQDSTISEQLLLSPVPNWSFLSRLWARQCVTCGCWPYNDIARYLGWSRRPDSYVVNNASSATNLLFFALSKSKWSLHYQEVCKSCRKAHLTKKDSPTCQSMQAVKGTLLPCCEQLDFRHVQGLLFSLVWST